MKRIIIPPRRIADKWLVAVAVTLGMFMSLMDSTIVNVAIPQMQHAFGADIQAVQWVITIYMLTQAVVIPTAPYLTARFGGKRAYVWTLIAFLLGSVLCGFAWDLPSLIFFRLLQGIGGGILLPLVMTLLYGAFPPEERGTAVSMMGIPLMVAPAFGPVAGGYLVSTLGWPWAFFINVPIGIIAILIAQKALPATNPAERPAFDGAGFGSIALGSAALLYSVSTVTGDRLPLMTIVSFVVGVGFLATFVAVELGKLRRGQEPLLNLLVFRARTYTWSVVTSIIVFFMRFGIMFLTPIYLQTLRQQTVMQAGMIQAAQALATLVFLPIVGRLADRIGPRPMIHIGLVGFGIAATLLAMLALTTPIWMIVGILMLLGASSAFLQQLPVAAMSQIPKEAQREIANGATLLSVLQATAAPIGVAVSSTLVQIRSQQFTSALATQGIRGTLLEHQSTLFAMHESFVIAAVLAVVGLVTISFVPKHSRATISEAVTQVEPSAL